MEVKVPHIPKEVYNAYLEEEKLVILLGAVAYDLETEEYTKPISKEQAEKLDNFELSSIVEYLLDTDIDFEANRLAYESLSSCAYVLAEREHEKVQEHEE